MSAIEERPAGNADEERIAYHEAAHGVAMWKLGFGIETITIEPSEGLAGHAKPARWFEIDPSFKDGQRRYAVEQNCMVLHAGSVAEYLLHLSDGRSTAGRDHNRIHHEMYQAEDDGSVQITWCNYIWQRTYTLLAWPGQWKLIVALAHALLKHRTLDGKSCDHYLSRIHEALKHDPSMPNCKLIGEVTNICSPWHRQWHAASLALPETAKRTELPAAVMAISAQADLRPIAWALSPLSTRAQRALQRATIRSVMDLECWSARSLRCLKGIGTKTACEIVEAAARAGVQLPPDDAPYPWQADRARWG